MTRETKIGLFTGFGVIILIGVLLSNYLNTGAGRKHPFAAIMRVGTMLRREVRNPVSVPVYANPTTAGSNRQPVPRLANVSGNAMASATTGTGQNQTPAALVSELPTHGLVPAYAATPAPSTPVSNPGTTNTQPVINAAVTAQPAGTVPVVAALPPAAAPAQSPASSVSYANQTQTVPASNREATSGAANQLDVVQLPTRMPLTKLVHNAAAIQGMVASVTGQADVVPSIAAGNSVQYTVHPGDTLRKIAYHYYHSASNASVRRLVHANRSFLKNSRSVLLIGRKLVIPGARRVAVRVKTPTRRTRTILAARIVKKVKSGPRGTSYRIRPGDTLAKIARKFLGSASPSAVRKIMRLNGLKSANSIRSGAVLHLPRRAVD